MHCFDKISMFIHSKQSDVQITLLEVAYVPGAQFNLFSLHAVTPECSVSLDAERDTCWMEFFRFCVGALGLM